MKLPAYGKSLLAARFQGAHPDLIQVIYGEDWTPARSDAPLLAVKPAQFAPGQYNWRCVAGVPVQVHDRDGQAESYVRAGVSFVAAECAEWSPLVEIFPFPARADLGGIDVRVIAFTCRSLGRWPVWWGDRLDQEYGERQKAYYAGLTAAIGA